MHNSCDVILTYSWNRVGYNILRSLSQHGLKVWTADSSKRNICSLSKYAAGSFVYPDPFENEVQFISCLLEKVDELHPRVLIPTHDDSIVIMRHIDEFPKDLIIPYDNADKLLMLSNKASATDIAEKAGVPIPRVYCDPSEVDVFPVVFKTVIGNSAKGVFMPKSVSELQTLVDLHKDEEMLLEEWIGGTDYSVDCIRWNGFWKSSVYHAILTKTIGGGTTTQREMVVAPVLEEYAKAILDYVDYKGVCGVDFRYDPSTGKAAFIEINARFTGGLATPVNAGFDVPWIVYKLATEGKYDEPVNVKIGTKTKWILGDVITLVGRISKAKLTRAEFSEIMRFKGFDAYDDYYKDDRRAILGEMSYYLGKLIKNGKLNP